MNNYHICPSFYNMGKSLNECLGCEYCFLKDYRHQNMDYPTDRYVPVSVNLFYGDPMLQVDTTVEILDGLEQREHLGKVVMITKGDLSLLPPKKYNLDLYIGLSTFGVDDERDGGSVKQFLYNVETAKTRTEKFFILLAPIIKGVNDAINLEQYGFPVAGKGRKKVIDILKET
jgi:hypothetical protein